MARRARASPTQIGLPVLEIDTDELNDPRYAANPTNRCYFCKTELWSRLVPSARERGFDVVADGTNADDLQRLPARRAGGARARRSLAARRFRILESRDPRVLARARPSDLAAAVVAVPLVAHAVRNAGDGRPPAARRAAEAALRALGIAGDLRVRHFGDLARVELVRIELARWSTTEARASISDAVVGAGYDEVEIDPRGFRSGALNQLRAGFRRGG